MRNILRNAAGRRYPAHVAALVTYPDIVRSALAVVADAQSREWPRLAGVGTIAEVGPVRVGTGEPTERMAAWTCEGAAEMRLTSDELAFRFGFGEAKTITTHRETRDDRQKRPKESN